MSTQKTVKCRHDFERKAYLSKSTNSQILPQNELADLYRGLFHGQLGLPLADTSTMKRSCEATLLMFVDFGYQPKRFEALRAAASVCSEIAPTRQFQFPFEILSVHFDTHACTQYARFCRVTVHSVVS